MRHLNQDLKEVAELVIGISGRSIPDRDSSFEAVRKTSVSSTG